jgi:hypothetical protein
MSYLLTSTWDQLSVAALIIEGYFHPLGFWKNTWKLWFASPVKLYSEVQETGFINFLCLTEVHCMTSSFSAGFVALTAVATKSTVFWDVTLCSPLDNYLRFGGTYWLHLQGWDITGLQVVSVHSFLRGVLISSILKVDSVLLPKSLWTSAGLHGVTSVKTVSVTLDGRRQNVTCLSLSCLGHEFFELLVLCSGDYSNGNFEVTHPDLLVLSLQLRVRRSSHHL